MINQMILPKAYKETYEIIKHLSEEDFNKIPKDVIKTLHSKMDKDYEVNIDFENFQNQRILYETQLLLAIIFRDYLATEKQKAKIIAKEKYDEQIHQAELRGKYNPENFFKKQEKRIETDFKNNNQNTDLIEYKKNIFQKIFETIKLILKKYKGVNK